MRSLLCVFALALALCGCAPKAPNPTQTSAPSEPKVFLYEDMTPTQRKMIGGVEPNPIWSQDAMRLFRALSSGSYEHVRERLVPLDVLKANRIDEPTLRRVFDEYIFPTFERYDGQDIKTAYHRSGKTINVVYTVVSDLGRSRREVFTLSVEDDKVWIPFQALLVVTQMLRSAHADGPFDPMPSLRKETALLESLGLKGTGYKVGEWRPWSKIIADSDAQAARQEQEAEKAQEAYRK